jgi:DNA-binding NtrC family response regulator
MNVTQKYVESLLFSTSTNQTMVFLPPLKISKNGKIQLGEGVKRGYLNVDILGAFYKIFEKEEYIQRIFEYGPEKQFDASLYFEKSAPLKPEFSFQTNYPLQLYSKIANYLCRIIPGPKEEYGAYVHYNPALPYIEFLENPILYFNSEEAVAGFNTYFYALVSKYFPGPRRLLNTGLDRIFINSPSDLTEKAVAELDQRKVLQRSRSALSLDPQVADITLSHPGAMVKRDAQGVRIENNLKDFVVLTCNEPLNFHEACTMVALKYQSGDGLPPVFMIGTKGFSAEHYLTPDLAGFSVGPNQSGNRILFKMSGSLVASYPINRPDPARTHEMELRLSSRILSCRMDDVEVFSFYNFNIINNWYDFLNFGIRPNHHFLFSGITLAREERAVAPLSRRREYALQFRQFPSRYFSVSYIANPYLKARAENISGIMLHEVTDFQEQVQYEREKGEKLLKKLKKTDPRMTGLVGNSAAFAKVVEQARTVAGTRATILIQGETGCGKEMIASAIHVTSSMAKGPFVKMDCSTIPETLFESLVFGHAKGAFTGADSDAMGLLESADNGTVFIDEIHNLNLQAQAKLLQVLQDTTITRVGSNKAIKLNLRFIAASNRDLEALAKKGVFRNDLLFRVNAVVLNLPPLSKRKEDIPELCDHFIRQYNQESGKSIQGIEQSCYAVLYGHAWPGNIRELRNVIQRACIFSEQEMIIRDVIRQSLYGETEEVHPDAPDAGAFLGRITRGQLEHLLEKHKGKIPGAAREIGVTRSAVYYNLKKLKINPAKYRQ